MKIKISNKKIIFTIFVLFLIINIYIFIFEISEKKLQIETIKNNNQILDNNLISLNENYNQNISYLKKLQTGNDTNLYNPLYNEAKDFIKRYKSDNTSHVIKTAKNNGLRCALALSIIGEEDDLLIFEGISFNTSDKGTIYFETKYGYEFYPEINTSLYNCIEKGHPYEKNPDTNDTIIDQIIIW